MINKHPDIVHTTFPEVCPEFCDYIASLTGWNDSDEALSWRCFHLAHDLYLHDLPGAKATKKKRKSRWLRFDPTHLNDFAALCDMLLL